MLLSLALIRPIVASHADAWIEINWSTNNNTIQPRRIPRGCVDWNQLNNNCIEEPDNVASHADAWIEIPTNHSSSLPDSRRIPRGCVDWNNYEVQLCCNKFVASHADAWIEICSVTVKLSSLPSSHPTRMRGLKYLICEGLKIWSFVASHADAWIEIYFLAEQGGLYHVASHADAWIEIKFPQGQGKKLEVASHADAWIEI